MTDRVLTIGIFTTCVLSLVALGLLARIRPQWVSSPHALFGRLLARRVTRVAVVLAWAWLGWHFLVTPPR